MGLEPTTPRSPGECSTHWATYKGAALGGTRTHNTQQSRRVLYTLSYVQRSCPRWDSNPQHPAVQASALHTELRTKELPWVGLEPTTPSSPGECSTHWTTYKGAALGGTRTHNTQQSRRVLYTLSYVQGSCPRWDSNPQHPAVQASALHTELRTKELPWVGLEPTTPSSPGECSTHWATYKGAALGGTQTHETLCSLGECSTHWATYKGAGLGGTRTHNTPQSRRVLYTLSYVQRSCPRWDSNPRDTLQSRRVLYTLSYVQRSWPRWDSNPQHPAVQASALHTELRTKELP